MKVELSGQMFQKYSNVKFHKNPSSVARVLPCWWMEDGRTDM